MRLQNTGKRIVIFERNALDRAIKYEVEEIEETSNSGPVELELFGGMAMMLPRKKYEDIKRFMESKYECLVITMHWDGRLECRRCSEKQCKKLLEKISSS